MSGEQCKTRRDFTRHIVNKILAEAIEKIPASAMSELRKRFGRAEDKYRFTIYGGNVLKLIDFFRSSDWRDLVDYAKKMNVEWIIKKILEETIREYSYECPEVAEAARLELSKLEASGSKREPDLTAETLYRKLKYAGFKVEAENDEIVVEEPYLTVKLKVAGSKIEYTICKSGKTTTVESILTKIEKIKEL